MCHFNINKDFFIFHLIFPENHIIFWNLFYVFFLCNSFSWSIFTFCQNKTRTMWWYLFSLNDNKTKIWLRGLVFIINEKRLWIHISDSPNVCIFTNVQLLKQMTNYANNVLVFNITWSRKSITFRLNNTIATKQRKCDIAWHRANNLSFRIHKS